MYRIFKKYVVEIGTPYPVTEPKTGIEWKFFRGFNQEEDARVCAEREAETNEYVRWGLNKENE